MNGCAYLIAIVMFTAVACKPDHAVRVTKADFPDNVLPPEPKASQAEQKEINRLLDEAIQEAFKGAPSDLSHADRMKRLNWWVHTHTHLSNPEAPISLLNTLQQRRGACGAVAYMFMEMAKHMGYKARSRGIFCLPIQGGHVVNEVFYDGEWRLFDPTFGVFFTSDGLVDSPVVEYNHLDAFPEIGAYNVFYPNSSGRQGWYYPVEPYKTTAAMYQRAEPAYLKPLGSYDIFAANNCGSTAYENTAVITLPMQWHLAGRTAYALGQIDGSNLDIIYQRNDQDIFDATSQYMLGDASGSLGGLFVHHRYIIDGLARGQVWRLRIDWLAGEGLDNFRYTVYGGIVRRINRPNNNLELEIEARAPVMEIVSWSEGEKQMQFDAVTFKKLE